MSGKRHRVASALGRRSGQIALLIAALAVGLPAYLFLVSPNGAGIPSPNHWDASVMPVAWQFDPTNATNVVSNGASGISAGQIDSEIQAAVGAWVSAANGLASAREVPYSGVPAGSNEGCGNGANTVTFNPPSGFNSFEKGTLAVTISYTIDTPGACGSSLPVGSILDADIFFNPKDSNGWTINPGAEPTRNDMRTVLTHEFGHFLGMEHTGIAGAIMFPYAPEPGVTLRDLLSDDSIGIRTLYGGAGGAGGGTLAGAVVDENGGPVSGAHVVAVGVSGGNAGQPVASTLSLGIGGRNRSGLPYEIDGLPPGSYIVYAEPLDHPVTADDVSGFTSGVGMSVQTNFTTRYH